MKLNYQILVVLFLSFLLSCEKEKPTPKPNPNDKNYVPYIIITGKDFGTINTAYTFKVICILKGGYSYIFDWGDGTVKEEILTSSPAYLTHTWAREGVFQIRVKERNNYTNEESLWSEPFVIKISGNSFTRVYSDDNSKARLFGHEIYQTSDGGYLILGTQFIQEYYNPIKNMFALKTDEMGNEQWRKILQTNIEDGPISGIPMDNEILILYGNKFYKINYNGDVTFSTNVKRNYAGSCKIIRSKDGNLFIYGSYHNNVESVPFVEKLNSSFETIWISELITESFTSNVHSLIEENDGTIMLWLSYQRVAKLDKNGHILWTKAYAPHNKSTGTGFLIKDNAGNYLACYLSPEGCTDANYNLNFLKIDNKGNIISSNSMLGKMMTLRDITITKDNAIVACGWRYRIAPEGKDDWSNYLCYYKISFDGELIWGKEYLSYPPGFFDAIPLTIITANDNGIVICGYVNAYEFENKMFLMKTDEYGTAPLP